jgi:hypothetical protein
VVETFDRADGLGTLRLADGASIRFGRSACTGEFIPAEGLPVRVVEVGPHPLGGWRAISVVALQDTTQHSDALLDAQSPLAELEESVALARQLGFVTVLLDGAVPRSRHAFRELLEPVVARLGGRLQLTDQEVSVRLGRCDLTLLLGAQPFPREQVDLRFWPKEASLGGAFIGLRHGLPGLEADLRRITGAAADPWAPDGLARQRLRLVTALLDARGLGVIAHAAGHVAWPRDEWLRRVGNLEDPLCRAFTGLVDTGLHHGVFFTEGMDALGLPDVKVSLAVLGLEEGEAYERAQAAALAACHRMTFENRLLETGEALGVPVGIEVGPYPLAQANLELADCPLDPFSLREEGAALSLVPTHALKPVSRLWAECTGTGAELAYPPYLLLLRMAAESHGWRRLQRMTFPREELPAGLPGHEVLVFQRPDGVFTTMTCGIGRRAQPGGQVADDNAFVEFLVSLPMHHPHLAAFLSRLGRVFHVRGAEAPPWGPEHRVKLEEGPLAELGFPYVALSWAGKLEFAHGPPVCLYSPLPMSEAERAAVPMARLPEWIQEVGVRVAEERWARLLQHART